MEASPAASGIDAGLNLTLSQDWPRHG